MNKKVLYALGGIILSGSVLLSGNVYANYPENYHGASASDGRVDVSSVSYNGDVISLNLQLKELDHFAVEDLHKLWFDLVEDRNINNHLDTTIKIVDEEKGLVQFNFNINELEEGKVYGTRLYTEHSFAAILIPNATFDIGNKKVNIQDGAITVTEESTLSNEETTQTDKDTAKTNEKTTSNEKVASDNVNKSSSSEVSADQKNNTNVSKKSLPATTAVK